MDPEIHHRKDDHIHLAAKEDCDSHKTTWFEYISLIHQAIPKGNLSDIDLSIHFLNKEIAAPILIDALTGGTPLAEKINQILARVANKFTIPIGVGSQRIIMEDPSTIRTFKIARDLAPSVPIIANLGISQVIKTSNKQKILDIIDDIQADAIAIHLNALHEAVQPEGETNFENALQNLIELKDICSVPIIIKEIGSGISYEMASLLLKAEFTYLNIAGRGGTSFAAIEHFRAKTKKIKKNIKIGNTFWDWGIPTSASILEVITAMKTLSAPCIIIASGGIRSGLDAIKAMVLGADLIGMARPFLKLAMSNANSIDPWLDNFITECKIAMWLTGNLSCASLKQSPKVFFSELQDWIQQRNLKT